MSSIEMITPAGAPRDVNPSEAFSLFGMKISTLNKLGILVFVIVALIVPLVVESYTIFQFTRAGILAIAIVGLNLLTGINGQFSLGHSAFFALGAYVTAIMIDQWEVAYMGTLVVSGVFCFIAGFLFGLPALRLEGLYLALATFALAIATPQLLKYDLFEHWTGGVQGLDVFPPDWLDGDLNLYYFVFVMLMIAFATSYCMVHSRTGRAMIALRDNPLSAQTMGVNAPLYKSVTFGVSALFTGVAGSLDAIAIQYVAPDSFTFALAISLLVGLVIGGMGSIPGALFGGIFILFIPNLAEEVSKGLSWAVYGAFLILAVYVMPTGSAGLMRMAIGRFKKRIE